jgi:hypothetical protein
MLSTPAAQVLGWQIAPVPSMSYHIPHEPLPSLYLPTQGHLPGRVTPQHRSWRLRRTNCTYWHFTLNFINLLANLQVHKQQQQGRRVICARTMTPYVPF